MNSKIQLGDIVADVIHKEIKNIHLSVYPPTGAVRISAPMRMDLGTIRIFALDKLGWIKKQQQKLREQARETPREYLDRESHYLWGKRYLLKVTEVAQAPKVSLMHSEIILQVRPGADTIKRAHILDQWYRQQLKQTMLPMLEKWQKALGVQAKRIIVQRMKTRWGSCTPQTQIIRLNLELAKKPLECLEYIVVHELLHLIEPTHNSHFISLMDQFMPKWRFYRDELNKLPVRHEEWSY